MADSQDDFPPLVLELGGLRAALEIHAMAIEATVEELGDIWASPDGTATREEAYHDFVFYCFTRCCRTVRAITLLLDAFMAEETYPLSRSLYEHYLALACVGRSEHFLDDFLTKPIGLYAGTLEYPTSKRGVPHRRFLVIKDTGAELPKIASFADLARATGYKWDPALHDVIYAHLSEHAHPNMLASGDYRNSESTAYTVRGHGGLLRASFWACVCSSLAVSEVRRAVRKPARLRRTLDSAHAASRDALTDALSVLEVQGRYQAVPRLLMCRLAARRRRWSDDTDLAF